MLMRCRTARRWITRDLAGELAPGRVERLGRHVERCEGCRHERVAYAALDRALGVLPMTAAMPARLEQDTLRRVRLAASEDEPRDTRRVGRWLIATAPAVAAAAALVLTLRADAPPEDVRRGRAPTAKADDTTAPASPPLAQLAQRGARPVPPPAPRRRRIEPVVPSDPPPELAARPDLFVNLPLLRNLEKLQHFDAIQTTTVDGPEEDQSNG
jgi:hypothetical protein